MPVQRQTGTQTESRPNAALHPHLKASSAGWLSTVQSKKEEGEGNCAARCSCRRGEAGKASRGLRWQLVASLKLASLSS